MTKVILLIGLPGSGKSVLAHQLLEEKARAGETWHLFDDPQPEHNAAVMQCVRDGHHLIICDAHLCLNSIRENAETMLRAAGVTEIERIYFSRDVDACVRNIEQRNDGRDVGATLYLYAMSYNPPQDARPVWTLSE